MRLNANKIKPQKTKYKMNIFGKKAANNTRNIASIFTILAFLLIPVNVMAGGFNGSGTYNRYYNWTNDANSGVPITASRFDTEDNGFATGLSQCITKDGQQTVTANIPFAGFKLLNIGDATLAKDAVNSETLQDGGLIYTGTSAGTNTITAGTTPAIGSYIAGQTFRVLIANTNTGAATLNISGVGTETIDKRSSTGLVAVAANDLQANQEYDFFWDGTEFQVSGSNLDAGAAPIASPVFTGTPSLPTGTIAVTQTRGDNSTKLVTTAYLLQNTASVIGTAKNAKMSVTSASASGTFTADSIVVGTALNGSYQLLPSFSQSINLATTGAGGMDTGSAPTSGFVSLYAIAKTDGTQGILACNVTTSNGSIYSGASMPSGYTYSGLIGIRPTNGSSQFTSGLLLDREFFYQSPVSIFSNTTISATFVSQSLSAAVPPGARTSSGHFDFAGGSGAQNLQVAADANGTGLQVGFQTQATVANVNGFVNFRQVPLLTSQTIYLATGAGTSGGYSLSSTGYTF